MRVYMDGVFDMLHVGHARALVHCTTLAPEVELIVGIIGDAAAAGYKRVPLIPQDDRAEMVGHLRCVHETIVAPPLVVTAAFMAEHRIDLVVHGFADAADAARQEHMFRVPQELGKFRTIPYTAHVSTTQLRAQLQR